MILIFGGTTEGKKALSVCEEAAKPFFYSTKGDLQKIETVHGIRITGTMDHAKIKSFCIENEIQLIVDAAHPFAQNLHQNIALASEELNIPVVRLERNYPEHDKNLLWFDTYQEAIDFLLKQRINNLLALTGVNTITKLKPYWKEYNCWFRILDRDESRTIAIQEGFPFDKILFYEQGSDELALFKALKPEAIITKESGETGGFEAKIKAAKQLKIMTLVVKRPALSSRFISVYGENGLRKSIENLVHNFFELKTGYTTGSCATAATKAALATLLTGEELSEVSISLPNGEWIRLPIHSTTKENNQVTSSIIKVSGDDPDITNGREIVSTVTLNLSHKGVCFLQGEGVGIVTLPGLGLPIGDPAINRTPRMMMKRELYKVMRHYQDKLPLGFKTGIDVTISVPDGRQLALKTFNPKLGIIDGISIIGTSGIVKPFSSEAFIASIKREMQVAKALKCDHIVINSGAKSERFVKQLYPNISDQAFIHYGNFIGETIRIASELGIKRLTMGIMLGKAVKLAEGYLDTHSKKVVMNKDFLKSIVLEADCNTSIVDAIDGITMARQLWDIIPQRENRYFSLILKKCHAVCSPLFTKGELEVLLIDEKGNIIQ